MPLYIVKQDITTIECDAIVNAAKSSLLGGGGVDGAIHRAAGRELLEECRTLGGCSTGDAKITKGYKLPCKYVIHTVGPIWEGGRCDEERLLKSCYSKSLALAKEYNCESVAFPLISSGIYGYPKDQALIVAVGAIREFLRDNDMTVYIAVLDKTTIRISRDLFKDVTSYIDDAFAEEIEKIATRRSRECNILSSRMLHHEPQTVSDTSLGEMLSKIDDNFAVTLLKLIDAKDMTDVECYKKANVSKQTWYKIMNDKDYRPSRNTVIAFAIALELNMDETAKLLATVGFMLSTSSKFDIIIKYFVENQKYDIDLINETLFSFDLPCLGV